MPNKLVVRIVLLFLLAQLIGITILYQYIDFQTTAATGVTATNANNYITEPPQVENESYSFISIILSIIIGTVIILWLIKINAMMVWKLWFLVSITTALTYAFYPMIHFLIAEKTFAVILTIIIALALGYLKIFRANYIAHTIGELFIYAGLAALFVPILNLTSAIILLVLLAAYDYYMVNQAGHMVTLAKASVDAKLISGLYAGTPGGSKKEKNTEPIIAKSNSKIPPSSKKIKNVDSQLDPLTPDEKNMETTGVMVGGGDIAFPLFFAGALMKHAGTLGSGLLVAICATAGLIVLFAIGKKGKFYPAIPFVAAGCFIAMGIVYLI